VLWTERIAQGRFAALQDFNPAYERFESIASDVRFAAKAADDTAVRQHVVVVIVSTRRMGEKPTYAMCAF